MLKNYKRGLCILSTAAVMIASSALNGQNYKWGIAGVFGTGDQFCSDVSTDGAGNLYAVGSYKTEAIYDYATWNIIQNNTDATGYYDGYLAKYDRDGIAQWALQFTQTTGTNKDERVFAVATFPDGAGSFNVFVVGTYSATLTLPTTSGSTINLAAGTGQCGFIAKYNSDGVLQWGYKIDGSGTDIVYDVCVSADGSGGSTIYACGSFTGSSISCTGSSQSVGLNTTAGGSPGGTEAFLMRFSDAGSTGNPQWGRVMWSSGNDAFYAVGSAANGDVVVTGMLRGSGTIHTNNTGSITTVACNGADAIVLARYSVSGTYAHCISGGGGTSGGSFYDTGLAATIDVNGDAYFGGYFCGTCTLGVCTTVANLGAPSTTSKDFFVAKVDASGNCVWLKGGGTSNDGDAVQSIVVNNLGSRVYVAGNFKGNLSYGGSGTLLSSYSASNLDGFLLAMNADDGTLITGGEQKFGGSSHDDNGRTIAINAAEDIFVGSSVPSQYWQIGGSSTLFTNSDGSSGNYETALLRWDHSNWPAKASSGTCEHKGIGEWWNSSAGEWKISMVGTFNGNNVTFPNCSPISSTQNAVPNYTDDVYLTTCNSFGDYESFVQLMNGSAFETVTDHMVDASGNNYFTGFGASGASQVFDFVGGPSYTATTGTTAGFIGKFDNAGTYLWGVFLAPSAASSVEAYGITVDNSNDVYVTGGITGTVTCNTTSGSPIVLTAISAIDIFVLKYNSSGVLQWARRFGSSSNGSEKGRSISVDNAGYYYITGEYNTAGTLTLGSTLSSTSNNDIFVMQGYTPNINNGAPNKAINSSTAGHDYGYDVISLSQSEVYITGGRNTTSECFTGSVSFSSTPAWNWTASSTTTTGYVTSVGRDLVMGNNGYLYVTGYTGGSSGILGFGSLSQSSVVSDAFVVSYTSWGGSPTCLQVLDITASATSPDALALESGANSPDHGDNVLVAGASGPAFAQKVTTEGCVESERRPNPIVPSAVSESVLYSSLVYPNPLNGNATLEISTDADFSSTPLTVVITDMTGREVCRIDGVTSKLVSINAENFSDGLYYYQVMQENKMISNGKMVVSH